MRIPAPSHVSRGAALVAAAWVCVVMGALPASAELVTFATGRTMGLSIGGPFSGHLLDREGAAGVARSQIMCVVTGVRSVLVGLWAIADLENCPETTK